MSIEDRLESLERALARSRRCNRLLIFAGIAVTAAFAFASPLGSQEAKEPKTVRAGRFELVDSQGRVRGILGMFDEAATLMLADEKVETRCALTASKEASGLTLTAPNLKCRQHFATGSEGSVVSLQDSNGKSRLEISMLREGPEVWLSDAEQNGRAILKVGKDGPLMRLIQNQAEIWSTRK